MKVSILNGPNLNMLGKRDPKQYGTDTLNDIEQLLIDSFPNHEMTFFQSNLEGELVEAIQSLMESDVDGVIANFGGYSHSSVAIRDALDLIEMPIVEVHLSNIHAREEFRERTLTGAVVAGIITGFGKQSYVLGVHALEKLVGED
ncbi:type II 3-dehydroquinate dehydratase [Fodinibius sp. Rm-B-1B1-1]|uniref:type II 3-dehydroquinate dehydratase n=1 Tax=Fodinibius alkaliphilus TaxID=3140241 RepID=UPI00315B0AA7